MSQFKPTDPLDTTPAQPAEFTRLFGEGRMKGYTEVAHTSADVLSRSVPARADSGSAG